MVPAGETDELNFGNTLDADIGTDDLPQTPFSESEMSAFGETADEYASADGMPVDGDSTAVREDGAGSNPDLGVGLASITPEASPGGTVLSSDNSTEASVIASATDAQSSSAGVEPEAHSPEELQSATIMLVGDEASVQFGAATKSSFIGVAAIASLAYLINIPIYF